MPTQFTRTRVNMLHIDHLGNPCLPLPDGWRERLSPRARQDVELTNAAMTRCAKDLNILEDSLVHSVFSPLMVPVQSLLSVRTEHSRRAVAELRAAYPTIRQRPERFREISMAAAFENAYDLEHEKSRQELKQTSNARRDETDRHADKARNEISRLLKRTVHATRRLLHTKR